MQHRVSVGRCASKSDVYCFLTPLSVRRRYKCRPLTRYRYLTSVQSEASGSHSLSGRNRNWVLGDSRGRSLGRPPTGRSPLALPRLQQQHSSSEPKHEKGLFFPIGYIVTRITSRPDSFGCLNSLAPACMCMNGIQLKTVLGKERKY